MPQVIIIGNSGAARECYWLLQDMCNVAPSLKHYYSFKGFIGWDGHPANLKNMAKYDLGDAAGFHVRDELLVLGIGNPSLRKLVYEHYKDLGASFLTLVHPWSEVSATAQLGEANIFQRGSTVFCDTVIGNANYFNGAVNISHDVCIGDYNFIGPFSLLLGECSVGSCNTLGAQVTVLPLARIGNSNSIAPGSFVYKGCKDNCRMAGNPALKID